MQKFAYALLGLIILVPACTQEAKMNGNSPKKGTSTTTKVESSNATPSMDDGIATSVESTTTGRNATGTQMDTAAAQPVCVNHLLDGITDPASGRHFRLLPNTMAYCQGAAACANLSPGGRMIWRNMTMPDEVEACSVELGYWYQNYREESWDICPGFSVVTVGGGKETTLDMPAPIICTY